LLIHSFTLHYPQNLEINTRNIMRYFAVTMLMLSTALAAPVIEQQKAEVNMDLGNENHVLKPRMWKAAAGEAKKAAGQTWGNAVDRLSKENIGGAKAPSGPSAAIRAQSEMLRKQAAASEPRPSSADTSTVSKFQRRSGGTLISGLVIRVKRSLLIIHRRSRGRVCERLRKRV
jgi:hypothetical protein